MKDELRTITKILEISTIHITEKDNEKLKTIKINDEDMWVIKHVFGFIILINTEEFEEMKREYSNYGLSNSFIEILEIAKRNKCQYINIDRDNTIYNDLEKYNW